MAKLTGRTLFELNPNTWQTFFGFDAQPKSDQKNYDVWAAKITAFLGICSTCGQHCENLKQHTCTVQNSVTVSEA